MKRIITGIYIIVTCITILVMLVSTYTVMQEKFYPAFIIVQEFTLPLVIALLAVSYLVFFEPERLVQKKTLVVMRILLTVTITLFCYFCVRLDFTKISGATETVYFLQFISLLAVSVIFFRKPGS